MLTTHYFVELDNHIMSGDMQRIESPEKMHMVGLELHGTKTTGATDLAALLMSLLKPCLETTLPLAKILQSSQPELRSSF